MNNAAKITTLEANLKALYGERHKKLPFHGWHHVHFVRKKSLLFCDELGADAELVEVAALTHDLNYISKKNSNVVEGKELRQKILQACGFDQPFIDTVHEIVKQADIDKREITISIEAQALSDADTLFKVLPITPILFAHKYMHENNVGILNLSEKIVSGWDKPLREDYYFYTSLAKENYLKWANLQFSLWTEVVTCLGDKDVIEMLTLAGELT